MPLSEREERILAEIERNLAAEDPRFGRRRRRLPFGRAVWRLRAAVALGLVGIVLVALLTFDPVLGALGLALLLTAIPLGVRATAERTRELARPVPPDERR
jgi:hypothetical protein